MPHRSSGCVIFYIIPVLVSFCCAQDVPCNECPVNVLNNDKYMNLEYTPSLQHIVNPGRGFTELISSRASNFQPLTVLRLEQLRGQDGVGMAWRQYVLDDFVSSSISSNFLNLIRQDLANVRQARFTTLLRFMYTDQGRTEAPYGDATKSWMLSHIGQLAPIFIEYEDVIDTVQAGFIGIWGEWYYTTYFGDPNYFDWNDPDNVRGMTPQNWQDRREVLQALLDNTPKSITVQVRVPQYKREILRDYTPSTRSDMEQQQDKARIGHHNDCFLATDTDMGTYINYTEEYPYLQQDSLWSSMGGETCALAPNGRHRCATAVKELGELRWTYVNQIYNLDVLQVWKDEGCYNEIHRRLGYRFVINKAVLPEEVHPGGHLCYHLELENLGHAAPFKDREVSLVLRSTGGAVYSAGLPLPSGGLRALIPGQPLALTGQLYVPDALAPGQYEVLLLVADKNLYMYSDYNLLLASTDVPEFTTGFNTLLHTIQVLSTVNNTGNPSCSTVQGLTPPEPSPYARLYCGLGQC